ncbi:hypothetical protein BpHYR1_042903 [Brachionus plicatilis]|uniref:Uncharacterized protein n=1 Tax=Brachionus plicatilis TaxID=10195 RepID=A0A3M7T554_BRAPC|nr:hypothetical protein BpHYR1_042903 [Brachionus plicatilis]
MHCFIKIFTLDTLSHVLRMLVEICNPNPVPSSKQGEYTIHFLSNKKPHRKENTDQITYLPNNIKSQLMVQKLAKISQKAFKFTTGKNKQAEKRLKLELNLIEKDYAFEDSNWLREYTSVKKSVEEVKTSSASIDRAQSKNLIDEDFPRSRMAYSHKSSFHTGSGYLRKTPSCKMDQCSTDSLEKNFFKSLKSYKSMIGFKNDRSEDQLKNFSLKKISNTRSMTEIDQESNCQICDDEIEEIPQESLNSNYLNEILAENKSRKKAQKQFHLWNKKYFIYLDVINFSLKKKQIKQFYLIISIENKIFLKNYKS